MWNSSMRLLRDRSVKKLSVLGPEEQMRACKHLDLLTHNSLVCVKTPAGPCVWSLGTSGGM